jgi:hypothetical protein
MQIHEITQKKNSQVDEGLLDLAKKAAGAVGSSVAALGRAGSAVASPFRAVKGAYQTAAGTTGIAQIATKAARAWNAYAETLKAATPDPQRYATLYKQALEAFVQKNLLSGQRLNSAINQKEIRDVIDQIIAVSGNPQQVTQLFPKLVQQAAASQQNIDADGVKIVSLQPSVIEYRNVVYAQNDEGTWANQKTGRVPDGPTQEFFDQQLALAQGNR